MNRPSGDGGVTTDTYVAGDALVSRSCRIEDASVGAVLETTDGPRCAWSAPDGLEFVGLGVAARITADGANRFSDLRTRANEVFGPLTYDGPEEVSPRAFGGVSFHAEPTAPPQSEDPWLGFEAASFVIPRIQLVRTADGPWLTVVGSDAADAGRTLERWRDRMESLPAMRAVGETPQIVDQYRTTDRDRWADQVTNAVTAIESGALAKVVLAQAVRVSLDGRLDVSTALERLRRRYPNCYRFSIDVGTDRTFFGAPPERLARLCGTTLETEALAGSAPRGETPEADDRYANRLRETEKLNREHEFVVDAISNHLEPHVRRLTVADRTVRKLATIQHLQTPISAELEAGVHVLDVVEALHPTPAVGGVPQERAIETIASVEDFDRGWYAAPIGWFNATGDGEFAVGIRSGVATEAAVTLFAGNGIVRDSDPDEEWDEIELKLRPILDELR